MQETRITTRLLAECLGVGKEAARKILERDLPKRKSSSRFVQHSLTAAQSEHRVECCRSYVEFADQDRGVLQRTVTGYESWYFISLLKRNDEAWKGVVSHTRAHVVVSVLETGFQYQPPRPTSTQGFSGLIRPLF